MNDNGRMIQIGSAESLVLGLAQFGSDPDGSDFPMEFEFECDSESDPTSLAAT